MRYLLFIVVLCSCSTQESINNRYASSLIDDMSGVWVYPSEQPGETMIIVVEDHLWSCFGYDANRIDTDPNARHSDSGEILGQESVYFFASSASFYSPKFLLRSPNGTQFMILNRSDFESFKTNGTISVQIWIRVADKLDPAKPPLRPSIASLGVPFDNIFDDYAK